MAVNLGALAWDNWFSIEKDPAWPAHLTKAAWDKKKGLIAKATPTGIGAQLLKTKAAFDGAADKRARLGARNIDELGDDIKKGLKFISSGSIKKLHDELKNLRDVAKAAKETYKRSKAPGLRDTIKLCEVIESDADALMVACNANSLKGQLATYEKHQTEKIHASTRKIVGVTIQNMRSVPAKVANILKALRAEVDALEKRDDNTRAQGGKVAEELDADLKKLRSHMRETLFTAARDMTQPALNLRKILQAGVTLTDCDPKALEKIKGLLVPYGNGSAADCSDATYAQMRAKIADVDKGRKLFEPIAKDCKEAGT